MNKIIIRLNVGINFIEVFAQPQLRLKAWKPFEGYTRKAEKNEKYLGDFLAFLASIFYSLFLLIFSKLRDRISNNVIMFVSGIGSTIVLFVLASFEGFQVPKILDDFLPILELTIYLQVIGHNLLSYCQGKLNVTLSSVICLFQAGITTGYSFIVFGETISKRKILGMIVVMVGIVIVKIQFSTSKK